MVVKIPKFQYKAVNWEGQVVEGVLESYDPDELVKIIRSRSMYPVDIRPVQESRDFRELDLWGKISSKDLSIFCRQFASLLKAGVSISEALDILSGHTFNRRLKNSIKNVHRLIHTGRTLTEALSLQGRKFPNLLIRTAEAGEISGTLDLCMERMADYFQKEYMLIQKIKKAVTYPSVVAITAIVVVFFLIKTVVPQFVKLFEGYEIELPLPTRIILSLHDFISNYGAVLSLIPLLIYTAVILIRKKNSSRIWINVVVLRIPFIGELTRKLLSVKFSRILALLWSSGVSLTRSLDITAKVIGNLYIEQCLRTVIEDVQKGKGLGHSLKKINIFPTTISRMVTIGEESGQLEEMMENIADFFEIEFETSVEKVVTLLEPLVIIVLGGIIAFIIMAVALPIFNVFRFTAY